ncbi:MAG: NAD(P)H-dependent oxidoreductase [Planctomycetota bacterium]|nr:NAD(P)H-dependent oxidoreductase [Planctomycetota bacterium]
MIRVLVVRGSPFKGGNSDRLADEFLKGAEGVISLEGDFRACDMNVGFCRSCRICEREGECVLEDEGRKFYKSCSEVDVLVVATPLHFGGLPSRLVALVERAQVEWARNRRDENLLLSRKHRADGALRRGYIIVAGGEKREAVGRPAIIILRNWFATLGFTPTAILYAAGYNSHNEVAKDTQVLHKAFLLGKSLCG